MVRVKTMSEAEQYRWFGPNMEDAFEAMVEYRARIVNAIQALEKCRDMGLLGTCRHGILSARREGLVPVTKEVD